MEKVTIIIPAYNEEDYIENTLKSIKSQIYKNIETIVVCNGCTDKTFQISKKYADVVLNIKEKNVSKARNLGAAKAKGSSLIFLDADTILEPNVLANISLALKNGNLFGTCKGKSESKTLNSLAYISAKNIISSYIMWSHGLTYCKKSTFNKVGRFDESKKTKGELKDLLKRLKKVARYKCVNSSYVISSERRIKKWGALGAALYWIKETVKPSKEDYEAIR